MRSGLHNTSVCSKKITIVFCSCHNPVAGIPCSCISWNELPLPPFTANSLWFFCVVKRNLSLPLRLHVHVGPAEKPIRLKMWKRVLLLNHHVSLSLMFIALRTDSNQIWWRISISFLILPLWYPHSWAYFSHNCFPFCSYVRAARLQIAAIRTR